MTEKDKPEVLPPPPGVPPAEPKEGPPSPPPVEWRPFPWCEPGQIEEIGELPPFTG